MQENESIDNIMTINMANPSIILSFAHVQLGYKSKVYIRCASTIWHLHVEISINAPFFNTTHETN